MTWEIAILGDLHGHWDDQDAAYFNASDYAMLWFTGDLGSGTTNNGLEVTRSIARLNKPALIMPGNNDAGLLPEMAAELGHQKGLIKLMHELGSAGSPVERASGAVSLCGFSVHEIDLGGDRFSLVAARPLAMGGGELSFPTVLARNYGVEDLAASEARMWAAVEQAETDRIVFLAHNGPFGLGGDARDPFGCDFKQEGGDWGDPDLTRVIERTRDSGREVAAIIAGHMHHRTHAGERTLLAELSGTPVCNAARVPRLVSGPDGVTRHHWVLRPKGTRFEILERTIVTD